MIKTVFLDIDNTLICFRKCGKVALKTAFINNGIEFKEEYAPIFFCVNDGLWDLVEKGKLTREGIYAVRFKKVLEALKIETEVPFSDIEKEFRNTIHNVAECVDGAKELIEYLAKKYRLCVASNSIYEQQVNRLKIAGLFEYFDKIFVSENIGFSKPQKQFFERCFSQLGDLKPSETVMIGDSLTADISGAHDFGMQTIWYNHLHLPIPQKKNYDYLVDSLLEIKNIL